MRLELKARCTHCNIERTMWGYVVDDPTPTAMDLLEKRVDQVGSVEAHCPKCGQI